MRHIFCFIALFTLNIGFSQDDIEEEEAAVPPTTMEIGFDGHFGASNFGGSFGVGGKFGYRITEDFVAGPSIRVQRSWSNYYGEKFGYTIYGGGLWAHYRVVNYLFVGAEFEMLNSPLIYNTPGAIKRWVPTLFLGGGFSHEFASSKIRLNAGIFYDIIDNPNSPFRFSYFMRKSTPNNNNTSNSNTPGGALIPVIYRLGVFFPIN